MKVLSVSTQRRAGGGTTRTRQPALLPQDGNGLRDGNLLHGVTDIKLVWTIYFLWISRVKVFRLQAMAIPSWATWSVNCTQPTHTSHSRTRYFFLAWLKTWVIESGIVVWQDRHSSYRAQYVTRAFVVVPFTLEHYFTFHMRSNPTIHHTFIDVFVTRGFILRRSSIECVFPSSGWNAFAHRFFHRPRLTSTDDSAESIATPPESDLGDERMRNLPASPLYLQEREKASAGRSRVYHSFRENSVSSSSHFRESAGKPAAMFSHKRWYQPVQGKDETLFRFSDPEEAARLVLEEQRDHLLAEAESEILKQECEVAFVNFKDKLIPIVWKCIRSIMAVKNLEKSKPDFMKNWLSEKK